MLKTICLASVFFLSLILSSHAEEHGGGGEGGGSGAPNPMYLQLHEMQVPVIQNRRVRGAVILNLTLDLGTGESRKMMEMYQSFIHDKIYWDLYGAFGIIWSPDLKLNVPGLKKRIMTIVRKYFEEKDVKDVLIMEVREIERKDVVKG